MINELTETIGELAAERGVSPDLIRKTIQKALLTAYKKTFGTDENAQIQFIPDSEKVELFSKKTIVEKVENPVLEVSLEESLKLNSECEIGDTLFIEVDPQSFDRIAIMSAKQSAKQAMMEIRQDTLLSEYKDKVGDLVVGYHQRERAGNIYVDLGNTEGILPRRFRSSRESSQSGNRIKALIYKVERRPSELQIILSRTHSEFVRRLFELEVPEIYDRTVEILKIAREPGYRTKIIVRSNRLDVDPVGACVGVRGVRILSIIRELEGEKVDIIKYSGDPRELIKSALAPAAVKNIVLLDETTRQALVVVEESQLSLCIGKMGFNIRLTCRLTDWNIDLKTEQQFAEIDLSSESRKAVSDLFKEGEVKEEEDAPSLSDIPDITSELLTILEENSVTSIEDLVALSEEELRNLKNISEQQATELQKIISEGVEIVESTEVSSDEEEKEDVPIEELPDITEKQLRLLKEAGVHYIVDLVSLSDRNFRNLPGLKEEDFLAIKEVIRENVKIVEEGEDSPS